MRRTPHNISLFMMVSYLIVAPPLPMIAPTMSEATRSLKGKSTDLPRPPRGRGPCEWASWSRCWRWWSWSCCFVKYKCGEYPARMMALEHVKCKSNIVLTFNFSKFGPNYCHKIKVAFLVFKRTKHQTCWRKWTNGLTRFQEQILSHILNELWPPRWD